MRVAKELAVLARENNAASAAIDGGGLGASPIDCARELQRRGEFPRSCEIIEVQFGASAQDSDAYVNRRAELWWLLRDWIKDEAAFDIGDDLLEELITPRYGWNGKRVKVEEKADIKKRLGRSTDFADALALAVSGHADDPTQDGDVWFL